MGLSLISYGNNLGNLKKKNFSLILFNKIFFVLVPLNIFPQKNNMKASYTYNIFILNISNNGKTIHSWACKQCLYIIK